MFRPTHQANAVAWRTDHVHSDAQKQDHLKALLEVVIVQISQIVRPDTFSLHMIDSQDRRFGEDWTRRCIYSPPPSQSTYV